ncbi:MAG: polysaccharide deacetylase family protein [Ferruginibacter sp.]
MLYFVRSPWWMQKMFPERHWRIKTSEKNLYFTFDDGPEPGVTEFVLDELARYGGKASFFCVGRNVASHPDLYQRIIAEGHSIGNHTYNHLNGWNADDKTYIRDIADASEVIDSRLFRPPYGRMKRFQQHLVKTKMKIIMWSLLSGDFDTSITQKRCLDNVVLNARPGDIIVYHDSKKAFPHLEFSLPLVLKYFHDKGYVFCKLPETLEFL